MGPAKCEVLARWRYQPHQAARQFKKQDGIAKAITPCTVDQRWAKVNVRSADQDTGRTPHRDLPGDLHGRHVQELRRPVPSRATR